MTQSTRDKLSFVDNLAPSEDFGLNIFLGKLDESLTDEELEKLKFYCAGSHGIGKRVLEKIKRPLDLFTKLKERGILSRGNLLILQAMLWFLPRKDLQKQCADFSKSQGNALHFEIPKDKPENGYRYVKFHIEGKDLDTFAKPELEHLRHTIDQSILMIPPEFVIVRGIEPDRSLIITLMIPAEYVDQFLQLNEWEKQILLSISVNTIYVQEVEVHVSVSVEAAEKSKIRSAMEEELRKQLNLLKQREDEMENLQLQNIDLQERLADLKNENCLYLISICSLADQARRSIIHFQNQLIESEKTASELTYLSALSYFRYTLAKVRQKKYSEDIISNLLDAQCLLINQRKLNLHAQRVTMLHNMIKKLQQDVAFMQYERDKLAYYHGLGKTDKIMSQREEYFMSVFLHIIPTTTIDISFNVMITDECEKYAIDKLARDITNDEVKIVLQNLKLSEKEKRHVGHSALKLLKLLLKQKKSKSEPVEHILNEKVALVLKRPELIINFTNYAREYYSKEQQRQMGQNKRTFPAETDQGRRKSSSQASTDDTKAKLDEIIDGMKKMDERLKKMEENKKHSSDLLSQFRNDDDWMNKIPLLAKLNQGQYLAPRLITKP